MTTLPDPPIDKFRQTIRNELIEQASKSLLLAGIVAIGLAATGWWLYLKPELIKLAGGVPAGAVVAFDLPESCPDGWDEFQIAAGRSIIGTGSGDGLSHRNHREVGGEERHVLTIPELPSHNHSGNVGLGGASFEHHQSNSRMPSEQWQVGTGYVGEGKAHENMPPFIALRFCKKRSAT